MSPKAEYLIDLIFKKAYNTIIKTLSLGNFNF